MPERHAYSDSLGQEILSARAFDTENQPSSYQKGAYSGAGGGAGGGGRILSQISFLTWNGSGILAFQLCHWRIVSTWLHLQTCMNTAVQVLLV